jgi:subtilisin family serine protease
VGGRTASPIVTDAIARATAAGVAVVAAAGNDGSEGVAFPASDANATAVVGVTVAGGPDAMSSFGFEADLGAPSVDVVAPFPHTVAGYGRWRGTSIACAFVSAAVADVAGVRGLRAVDAARLVVSSTTPYPYFASGYGSGLLNVTTLLGR